MRKWLKNNKIFFETIIPVFVTGIALIVSFVALNVSFAGRRIAETQLILAATPIISIEPSENVKGEVGVFGLSIKNLSLVELQGIGIYEDYFVSLTPESGTVKLFRFGSFSTNPNSSIPQLKPNEEKGFEINFKSIYGKMSQFYRSEIKGHRMKIARLRIRFQRKIDGKEFIQSKAYIITGHGDSLLDYDERGLQMPGQPTFEDIKKLLGVYH